MYILGLVFSGGKARAALYTEDYNLVALREDGLTNSSAEELIKALLDSKGVSSCEVKYIGVAVDASFDVADVKAKLEKAMATDIFVVDIISARALGEAYLSGDIKSLVMLNMGDELESAIVIDKKLYVGSKAGGGKLAHMVIDANGYECSCGLKGCFEAYVSNNGVKNIAREAGMSDWQSITVSSLFDMNDDLAKKAQERYIQYLSAGITNIINFFQPEELVVDGNFFAVGDALVAPTMDIILKEQYTKFCPDQCHVRAAIDSLDTSLMGAVLINR